MTRRPTSASILKGEGPLSPLEQKILVSALARALGKWSRARATYGSNDPFGRSQTLLDRMRVVERALLARGTPTTRR